MAIRRWRWWNKADGNWAIAASERFIADEPTCSCRLTNSNASWPIPIATALLPPATTSSWRMDYGQEVPGNRSFGLMYQNRMYLFSSEASEKAFLQNRDRYAAQVMQAENQGRTSIR